MLIILVPTVWQHFQRVLISDVPPFAVKCQFLGVAEQADVLQNLITDKTLSVVFRAEKDGVHEVDVCLDGASVIHRLGLQADTKLVGRLVCLFNIGESFHMYSSQQMTTSKH